MSSYTGDEIQKYEYIPALDGLRGVAIIMVVLYHYFNKTTLFNIGWIGVDIFFPLSGYLITGRLLEKNESWVHLKQFYKNRALRILPLYYLTLAVFYLLINFALKHENSIQFAYYNNHVAAFISMLQNFLFVFRGVPAQNHLEHLWSIAVEEHFYIIWPLLLMTLRKIKITSFVWPLIFMLIIALRTYIYYHMPQNSLSSYYHNSFCRFDSLFAGCWIALFIYKQPQQQERLIYIIFIAATILLIFGLATTKHYSPNAAFFATIGYTLVAFFIGCIIYFISFKKNSWLIGIFSWRPLVHLGKISFGIYLIHFPIYIFFVNYWNNNYKALSDRHPVANYIGCGIACFIATYLLSTLSYKYYESYFLKFKSS